MPSEIFRHGLLDGQLAVVTGGGTGIGRATALELAACGATVVVAGRRAEPLGETASLASGGACEPANACTEQKTRKRTVARKTVVFINSLIGPA